MSCHFFVKTVFWSKQLFCTFKILKLLRQEYSHHHSVSCSLKQHQQIWQIFSVFFHLFHEPCTQTTTNINCKTPPKLNWDGKRPGKEKENVSWLKEVVKMQSHFFEFQNRVRLTPTFFCGSLRYWTSNYLKAYAWQCDMEDSIFWLSQNGIVN